MSLVQLFRPTKVRLAGVAGMLALPLLAGCAYEGGYYGSSDNYGYNYGDDYGYDGYGYGYGYGYGGYGYGGYGYPCWPYGCDDFDHRHRRHHDRDDDNDNDGHHHHGGDAGMNEPRFDPNRHAGNFPRQPQQRNLVEPRGPARGVQPPSSPVPFWIPPPRDSRR